MSFQRESCDGCWVQAFGSVIERGKLVCVTDGFEKPIMCLLEAWVFLIRILSMNVTANIDSNFIQVKSDNPELTKSYGGGSH